MRPSFRYEHRVGFAETNLVGNVYFSNHLQWQGRCREMFIAEYAPGVVKALEQGALALVTLRCSCEYFSELRAFNSVVLVMQLLELHPSRLVMSFDYYRKTDAGEELVAKGDQEIACMQRIEGSFEPAPFPEELAEALKGFVQG